MFGISFSELLLIFIIALVVFGPEQLPAIAKKIGGFVGSIKRLQKNFSDQIYQQTGMEQLSQLKEELNSAVNQIRTSLRNTNDETEFYQKSEREFITQEINFLYQPELEFDRQPELFDE